MIDSRITGRSKGANSRITTLINCDLDPKSNKLRTARLLTGGYGPDESVCFK